MAIIDGHKLSVQDKEGNMVGISISEIATVLGEPMITDSKTKVTGDALGYLSTSAKINPRSKCVPTEFRTFRKITMEQRKQANYGHSYTPYADALEAVNAVLDGSFFRYVGATSMFRSGDWDGYDHNTREDWFSTNINKKTSISVTQGYNVEVRIEDLYELFTYGALENRRMQDMNFGFLCWQSDARPLPQVYFISLTDVRNPEKQLTTLEKLTLNTGDMNLGKWNMYPCVTSYGLFDQNKLYYERGGDYVGDYYPIPYCNTLEVNVVKTGGDTDLLGFIALEDVYGEVELVDAASLTYKMYNCGVGFTNTSEVDYTIGISASVYNALNGVNVPNMTTEVVIPAKTEEPMYIELYSVKSEDEAYRFSIAEEPLQMEVRYWMQTDNGTEISTEIKELNLNKEDK